MNKKFWDKIKFYPHKGQKEVLECDNREVIICAGRRWGKSALMGAIIVYNFLKLLNEVKKGTRGSVKIWIVAPTYELSRKVFEYVVKFLLEFDKGFAKHISERPQPHVKISEGIWIQCKSATEPMSMLGEELDMAVIDEAPLIGSKTYHQYIYPLTMAKSRDCRTYLIGTPRGKDWFQAIFLRLKEKNAAFHFTSLDGVETDLEKLEEFKKVTPDLLFRQEYLAEFLDEAGTVFKNLDKIMGGNLQDARPGRLYTMGVDLGQMDDYTVITVLDRNTHELVHFDRFRGIEYPLQKEHIKAKAKRYNNARVIIDATGVGRPIYEDLGKAGVFVEDFTFSGKSKEELIGNLIVFVNEGYVKIPKIEVLVDELKAFEYIYINEKTGEKLRNTRYSAPKGFHDDCIMSLALAVWGIPKEQPKYRNPLEEVLKKQTIIKKRSFI